MQHNTYLAHRDDGSTAIAHGFKYIDKIKVGDTWRYFYDQASLAAYNAGKAVSNATKPVQNVAAAGAAVASNAAKSASKAASGAAANAGKIIDNAGKNINSATMEIKNKAQGKGNAYDNEGRVVGGVRQIDVLTVDENGKATRTKKVVRDKEAIENKATNYSVSTKTGRFENTGKGSAARKADEKQRADKAAVQKKIKDSADKMKDRAAAQDARVHDAHEKGKQLVNDIINNVANAINDAGKKAGQDRNANYTYDPESGMMIPKMSTDDVKYSNANKTARYDTDNGVDTYKKKTTPDTIYDPETGVQRRKKSSSEAEYDPDTGVKRKKNK